LSVHSITQISGHKGKDEQSKVMLLLVSLALSNQLSISLEPACESFVKQMKGSHG